LIAREEGKEGKGVGMGASKVSRTARLVVVMLATAAAAAAAADKTHSKLKDSRRERRRENRETGTEIRINMSHQEEDPLVGVIHTVSL